MKRRWLAFALAIFLCDAARAATQPGSLDAAAASADLLRVTCFDDGAGAPASLAVQVRDDAPSVAPLLSAQIRKGNAATNTTDPTDADAAFSPLAFVNGAAGVYDVFVDKSAAGAESYTLSFQCTTGSDGGGAPTGTSISPSTTPIPALPLLAWLALALVLGGASLASAHEQSGSLGAAASASDAYQVTCSNDGSGAPASLAIEILDAAPSAAPLVSAQLQRGDDLVSTTDPTDADASFGPAISVNGGAGAYLVLVDKSAAGAETYTLEYHCFTGANGTGAHTGTALTTLQNQ
jgi:hypothetical protein